MAEIKGKMSSDPEIAEIQKGLLYTMSHDGSLGILAVLSGIAEYRLKEIALGEIIPHAGEIITLKAQMQI